MGTDRVKWFSPFPVKVEPDRRNYLITVSVSQVLGEPLHDGATLGALAGLLAPVNGSGFSKPIDTGKGRIYVEAVNVRQEHVKREDLVGLLHRALLAGRENMSGLLIANIERALELEGVKL